MTHSLLETVGEVIEDNPVEFADACEGSGEAKNYLIGQALVESEGEHNPPNVRAVLDQYILEADK